VDSDWCDVLRRNLAHAATSRPGNYDLGVIMYAGELILSIIVIVFLLMVFIKD
jgi:hypothetical protein